MPATLAQIERALRAADAAGNTEDARRLAQAYAAARKQQAQPDFSNVQGQANTVPAARSPSLGQRAGRELGLGTRAMLEGGFGTIGMVTDPAARLVGLPSAREGASALADTLGLPRPETPMERVGGGITEALAGGGGIIGLGRSLATRAPGIGQAAGEFLSSQPGTQLLSLVGGSGAAGVTREQGGGGGSQLIAALAGGLGAPLSVAGSQATLRGLIRGGEAGRQQMQRGIADFASVGAKPSVGQAVGNRRTQGLESLLAGAPTSSGRMASFAERQAEDIGAGLQRRADQFFPNASGERAGREIQRGVREEGGFIDSTRQVANQLYQRLDEQIPKGTRVPVESTRAALRDLNSLIEGAPSVSRFFQNARLAGIEQGLLSDVDGAAAVLTQPGMRQRVEGFRSALQQQRANAISRNERRRALNMTNLEPVMSEADIDANVQVALDRMVDNNLPYEALQKLRTLVGSEIENASLMSDVPRSKWKALYGALSRDMESAATTPEAKQALARANAYFNARVKRIDAIDAVIQKHGGPEKVFNAVMSGTRDGGTTLRAVMQSLPEDGQRAVTAAVIKRMGLPTPGQAGLADAQFSAQTFLTNWNRVSPEAKRALFDRHGPQFSRDMDKIARVAQSIRDGSKVFANPSGTANRAAALGYYGSLAATAGGAAMGGTGVAPLAYLIGGGLTANAAARAMTNPRLVHWLARTTEMPASALPQQIVVLKQMARDGDTDAAELVAALEGH